MKISLKYIKYIVFTLLLIYPAFISIRREMDVLDAKYTFKMFYSTLDKDNFLEATCYVDSRIDQRELKEFWENAKKKLDQNPITDHYVKVERSKEKNVFVLTYFLFANRHQRSVAGVVWVTKSKKGFKISKIIPLGCD